MGFSSDIEELQRRAREATAMQVAAPPPTQEPPAEPNLPVTVGTGMGDDPDAADSAD